MTWFSICNRTVFDNKHTNPMLLEGPIQLLLLEFYYYHECWKMMVVAPSSKAANG